MSFGETAWAEVAPTPDARLVLGVPGSGKTQRLVNRAVELMQDGVEPDDVVVFAATPNAAQILKRRLSAADVPHLAERVTTPLAFALEVLDVPDAREFTGRTPRLLVPYERAFLLEDLKTSGLRPGRLSGLLAYLERGIADLCDVDCSWLETDEERGVHALLVRYLKLYGAVDDVEAQGLALRYLAAQPEARSQSFGHVLADDYQLLSRASQVLVNRVARDSAWIAADEDGSFEAFERFPNAGGVQEFVDANGWAQIEELAKTWRNADVAQAVRSMRREASIDAPSIGVGAATSASTAVAEGPRMLSGVTVERFAGPGEECRAAALRIAQLVDEGYAPRDIVVVSPHRQLRRALRCEFVALGVSAGQLSEPEASSGDVRSVRKCAHAIAACALCLAADEDDDASWRAWCGFGDALAASNAFAYLIAQEHVAGAGQSGGEAIGIRGLLEAAQERERAGEDLPESVVRALERYRMGLRFASEVRGVDHAGFVNVACRYIEGFGVGARDQAASLFGEAGGGSMPDSVPIAASALRERMLFPKFESENSVCVCDVGESAGLDPRVLVLVGFANGLFPSRDYFDRERVSSAQAERMRACDAAVFSCLVGRARETVHASSFAEVRLDVAQRLRLRVERIRLRDGARVACASPSMYLAYLQ